MPHETPVHLRSGTCLPLSSCLAQRVDLHLQLGHPAIEDQWAELSSQCPEPTGDVTRRGLLRKSQGLTAERHDLIYVTSLYSDDGEVHKHSPPAAERVPRSEGALPQC